MLYQPAERTGVNPRSNPVVLLKDRLCNFDTVAKAKAVFQENSSGINRTIPDKTGFQTDNATHTPKMMGLS
ncbi:MAG: hypothetical protein DKT66_25555 [Candidatus Melainabacteria bacterium]|nr:MAG: hypothetical protein DKT66_25555 [Candidatus Melainabacteria bacterium]